MATIYLIPNLLSDHSRWDPFFPAAFAGLVDRLDGLVIESVKSTGKLLKNLNTNRHIREIPHIVLKENMKPDDFKDIISEIKDGSEWGLVTDAGYPAVADPGSNLIALAHQRGIKVVPVPGSSSIILALASSGFNGQRFAFQGYLPRNEQERRVVLQGLVRESEARGMTQIFIEAPYRNQALIEECLRVLPDSVRLCLAIDLTGSSERILSRSVGIWKKDPILIPKDLPAIFLFLA